MAGDGAADDPWVALLTGQILGKYRLDVCVGEGHFSRVFEAVNVDTDGRFAVKVLVRATESGAVADFESEAALLRRLNNCKGVINFVDGGVHTIKLQGAPGIFVPIEAPYHVLTLASASLDELLLDPVARERLSYEEKLKLWRWAAKSLTQMHHGQVAHRDLKASNCLLMVRKNVTRVRLGDLGRAKDIANPPTRPPEAYLRGQGDFRFAAPEALFWQGGGSGQDFLLADYYGLGSLLVEIITGQSMTALVLGDFGQVLATGQADFLAGRRRELSVLFPRFRAVVAEVVAELPRSIQTDASVILMSLCHPVPTERLAKAPYSRDRASRDKLAWILRRADIMIRRLEIEARQERRRERVSA